MIGKDQDEEDKAEAYLLNQMEFAEASSSSGAKGNKIVVGAPIAIPTGSTSSSPRRGSSAHKNRSPVTEDGAIQVENAFLQNQSPPIQGGIDSPDNTDLDVRRLALETEMRHKLEAEQEVTRKTLEVEKEAALKKLEVEQETTRKKLEAEKEATLKELEAEKDRIRMELKVERDAARKKMEDEELERRRKLDELERDLQERMQAQQDQLKLIEEAKENKVIQNFSDMKK